MVITKSELDLDLDILEEAGQLALAEERRMTDSLTDQLGSLSVNKSEGAECDSAESSDSSSTETESDTESDTTCSDEDEPSDVNVKVAITKPCSLKDMCTSAIHNFGIPTKKDNLMK